MSNLNRLLQTIPRFGNPCVWITINISHFVEVVRFCKPGRDFLNMRLYVLVFRKVQFQTNILNVPHCTFDSLSWHNYIEESIGSLHTFFVCCCFFILVKLGAAASNTGTTRFVFLWSPIFNVLWVCNIPPLWHFTVT